MLRTNKWRKCRKKCCKVVSFWHPHTPTHLSTDPDTAFGGFCASKNDLSIDIISHLSYHWAVPTELVTELADGTTLRQSEHRTKVGTGIANARIMPSFVMQESCQVFWHRNCKCKCRASARMYEIGTVGKRYARMMPTSCWFAVVFMTTILNFITSQKISQDKKIFFLPIDKTHWPMIYFRHKLVARIMPSFMTQLQVYHTDKVKSTKIKK